MKKKRTPLEQSLLTISRLCFAFKREKDQAEQLNIVSVIQEIATDELRHERERNK